MIEDSRLNMLKEFLSGDLHVSFAIVFGSYANGRQEKARDIDVAIYFTVVPEGIDSLNLINKLSDIAGRDVDLVVLNKASAFLRHQVMKTGVQLIIKDRPAYIKFREKTISDYDEYKYVAGMNKYD
ncbi:MAG: nucleotidyltransferase domain-containing protein [Nitrospirae bacterium]|nr:nucleotidyltransferase domain-containing protein [Nitrospirota bacterium]